MKKILKVLLILIAIPYVVFAVFVTLCLINFNDYRISVFGDKSLIIIDSDEFADDFKKGSLVVVNKTKYDNVKTGEKGFFYNTYESPVTVTLAEVTKKEVVNKGESTYTLPGDQPISSEYFIGMANEAKVYEGFGTVLKVVESRYGFLALIILPILVAFIYEIYAIVEEMIHPKEED